MKANEYLDTIYPAWCYFSSQPLEAVEYLDTDAVTHEVLTHLSWRYFFSHLEQIQIFGIFDKYLLPESKPKFSVCVQTCKGAASLFYLQFKGEPMMLYVVL